MSAGENKGGKQWCKKVQAKARDELRMKETHERRPNRHCSRPYFSKREGRSAFEIVEPWFAVVAEMVSREVCAAIETAKVVDWGREQTIRRGGRTMRRTRQTRLIVPSACGALSDDMRYPVDTSQVRRCGVRHSRVAPLRKSGVRGTRNSSVKRRSSANESVSTKR